MTLPPEDRDLIERVLGYDADENVKTLLLTRSDLSNLLAAVRAEAAPVVDEGMVKRAIRAINAFKPMHAASSLPALEDARRAIVRAALEAALNPSREVKS